MKKLILAAVAAAMCFAFAGCGSEEATEDNGAAEEEQAMEIQILAGENNIYDDGTYAPIEIDASMSGTE